jgi:5'-3' exonuclease
MMISSLYRLDVDPDDTIIVAVDGRHSWRKDFETEYKGDRKAKREASGIDFDHWYHQFNILHEELNAGLDWHFIKIDRLEADDIMAVACRYYKDRPVILVTHDADLQQMWEYPNVKIFSTYTKKWKLRPDNFDLTRLQADKIYKEATDNMVAPVLNEEDYNNRRLCIDLCTLPDWVEQAVRAELDKIGPKECNVEALPFRTLRERLSNLWNDKSKVMSYDEQYAKEAEKEARKKAKKKELKEKEKRQKARAEAKIQKDKEKEAKLLARVKN